MADNRADEPFEDLPNPQPAEPPGEIIPVEDSEAINQNQVAENMEVHKHPHHVTHKKKWGEYILEFLMLFLAVFLGFVAENFREHQVEKTREKEYVKSLIEDLKTDSAFLHTAITRLIPYHTSWMDSTESLLSAPDLKGNDRLIYQAFVIGTSWTYDFHPTERTLTQLRSSGFYLIRNEKATKAISDLEDTYKLSLSVTALLQNMQNDIDIAAYAFADRTLTKEITDKAFKYFPTVNLQLADIPGTALIKTGNRKSIDMYVDNLRKYNFYLRTGLQSNYEFELKEIIQTKAILKEAYNIK